MKITITPLIAPLLSAALFLTGIPISTAADEPAGRTTGKDVSQKVDEAAHAIKDYSVEQRDEALKSAKGLLEEADARIDQLEQEMSRNWGKMNASARRQAQETMKILRRQRQDLSQAYGELKRSSAGAWEEVKGGFAKSYEALRESFSKAVKKF